MHMQLRKLQKQTTIIYHQLQTLRLCIHKARNAKPTQDDREGTINGAQILQGFLAAKAIFNLVVPCILVLYSLQPSNAIISKIDQIWMIAIKVIRGRKENPTNFPYPCSNEP